MSRITHTWILATLTVFLLTACSVRPSLEDQIKRQKKLELLLTEGVKYLRAENIEKAESAFLLAYELAPNDARVSDSLGCIAWRRNDFDRAEANFNRAVLLNPAYSPAIAHLAQLAERRGKLVEAKKLYDRAVKLDPLNYRARNNRAALIIDSLQSSEFRKIAHRELLKAQRTTQGSSAIVEHNLELSSGSRK